MWAALTFQPEVEKDDKTSWGAIQFFDGFCVFFFFFSFSFSRMLSDL
jgi:hypothetical protein